MPRNLWPPGVSRMTDLAAAIRGEKYPVPEELQVFFNTSQRRGWFYVIPGLQLYLRKGIVEKTIELANMEANPPGKGKLTFYIPRFESLVIQHGYFAIKVENIHNKRLIPFFEERGYKITYDELRIAHGLKRLG